jgi:GntR family transcriptional repressor for pyruvate dehydrogenase complex
MSSAPLPQFNLDAREPLESELARKLVEYFAQSGLSAGEKLPSERQMSEALGVGRAALRHALKSLSLLGVVEVRPSTGTYLRNGGSDLLPQVIEWGLMLGDNEIDHVIEARSTIEVALAGFAARRRTDEDIAHLTQLIAHMRDADNGVSTYVDVDVQFHLAIADAARNDVLAGVLRSLQSLLRVWARRVIDAAGETSSSLAMHEPVLEAIIAGDEHAARAAMSALQDRASRRLHDVIGRHKAE